MRLGILVGVGVVTLLGGCSVGADKEKAEAGVAHFHDQLNAGRYHDIYAGAAQDFRSSASEAAANEVMQRVHDRMGAFRTADLQGWQVNFNNGRTIVHLNYNSTYASGNATEEFNFAIEGDDSKLVGFNVNSPALLGTAPQNANNMEAAKPGDTVPITSVPPPPVVQPPPVAPAPSGGK